MGACKSKTQSSKGVSDFGGRDAIRQTGGHDKRAGSMHPEPGIDIRKSIEGTSLDNRDPKRRVESKGEEEKTKQSGTANIFTNEDENHGDFVYSNQRYKFDESKPQHIKQNDLNTKDTTNNRDNDKNTYKQNNLFGNWGAIIDIYKNGTSIKNPIDQSDNWLLDLKKAVEGEKHEINHDQNILYQ